MRKFVYLYYTSNSISSAEADTLRHHTIRVYVYFDLSDQLSEHSKAEIIKNTRHILLLLDI